MGKFLKWRAPYLDLSGYAAASRGLVTAAETAGFFVQVKDRSRSLNLFGKGMGDEIVKEYVRLSQVAVPPDCPTVQMTVPDCFVEQRGRKIGVSFFEMTTVPPQWVPFCNRMDQMWTGTSYSRKSFLNSGVTAPFHVVPCAIDFTRFNPEAKPWTIANRRAFAFVSVMDMTPRKAWKELLRAFWTAFDKDDDVCLVLKCYFGGFSATAQIGVARKIADWKKELGFVDRAPLLLYMQDVPAASMPGFYLACDCYAAIGREGFGLPHAEAMACGLPCIGPEVGGTTDFMDETNSLLVEYEGDGPIDPEMLGISGAFEDLQWANHSWEDLAVKMHRMATDSALRKDLGAKGMATVRERLSFETVGKRIAELLED